MSDVKVTELAKSTPLLTDYLLGIGADEEYQALVSDIAGLIIRSYRELVLAGKAQSLEEALEISEDTIQTFKDLGMRME